MTNIHAWQHIYSNVEQEQSPQKRGGFQTLFYTKSGLTGAEISEMEGRLLYFPAKTAAPVKRLFFMTTTGKGVVAQITPLPEPDQYGRQGRYLAHALVFRPEDLAKFEADPFRVFRRFAFYTTIDQVLAAGDFDTGDIPAVAVDLPPPSDQDVEAARAWSAAELKKLALLALRVEQQTQERQAVTVVGQPDQVEAVLEAAFLAAPGLLRPHCTFDAYFYRCNLVATFYWAIGLLESPVSIKFVAVDGAARQVQGAAPTQPETAYERWVAAAIEAGQLVEIARQRDRAFALGRWLDQEEYDLAHLEAASPALVTDVLGVNEKAAQSFLRRRLAEIIPPVLVERAAAHIYQNTGPVDLYRELRQGFEVEPVLDVLYHSYQLQKFTEPPRAEIKALDELLAEHDHAMLRLFSAYWRSPRRYLPEALEQTDEVDYRQFGAIALGLNLIKPIKLLIPGRGDIFLDLYLSAGVADWVELIEELIEAKETACLPRLADKMPRLSRSELNRVDRLTAEQADVPESFRIAVRKAIAALPPEKGLKGAIRSAWRRLPGLGDE